MADNNLDAIETIDDDIDETPEPVLSTPTTVPRQVQRYRPRYSSLRTSTKIYSVSFQENGFTCRETNANAANQLWSAGKFTHENHDEESDQARASKECAKSPVIRIPRNASGSDFDEDADAIDATDVTTIIPRRTKDTRTRNLSKSLDVRGSRNYQSTGSPSSNTIVFCIHGNKFGVARCCDDLIPDHQHSNHGFVAGDDMVSIEDLPPTGMDDHHASGAQSSELLHCHGENGSGSGGGIDKKARNKLILASILCLFFMVLEIIGGFLANSLAIATDAAHLLTDFASFMISLFSIWVASRPATRTMSFGWHRAEVIGATVSVLLIWVVTGILVYIAIERIISKEYEIDATIMLITSGVGVLVNIIMGCTLHQHGHGHSHGGGGHGHSHDNEAASSSGSVNLHQAEKENINVRAAFIHVLGDFLQSLGVFVAALVIYFKPQWGIIDPICTFVFSVLVLFTTVRILRDTMNVLMEGIPRDVSFNVVQDTFLSVDGIIAVHNLRIWGLTTDKTALAAHLAIAPGSNAQTILREASTRIRSKYNFYEMTLQVEEFEEDMDDCNQCKPPL